MNATEPLPTRAVIETDVPQDGHRYRLFFIVPKRDFGQGPGYFIKGRYVKEGWIVTDGNCNVMPGATWFQTIKDARHAIDIFIAVRGDATMFWEIMQPFQFTPGDKADHDASTATKGCHYAIVKGGIVVEVGMRDKEITEACGGHAPEK